MSLNNLATADVLAACQAGAAEAGGALSRSLDGKFQLLPGEAIALTPTSLPSSLTGPGLLVVLHVAGVAAVVAIGDATKLLPAWYTAPDATGTSKLTTLAQELGMLLLPEAEMPDDFTALAVPDMAAALVRGGLSADAAAVSLTLKSGAAVGDALLIWPIAKPAALAAPASAPVKAPEPVAKPAPAAAAKSPPAKSASPATRHEDLETALPGMPSYTRSLLKIRVPIVVTLAKSKQPLSRIVELAPGSIIPFAKSCDDTLSLEVNNREVAVGEAVKVGDKFGLRITSMIMPPEKFTPLKGKKGA